VANLALAERNAAIAERNEARGNAALAGAESAHAQEAKENAEAALDLATAGKLMSSGVTGGMALALQAAVPWLEAHAQRQSVLVAMPYLMVHPGYFGAPQPTREYCASAWGSGDDADAAAAAMGAARKSAQMILTAIKADLRVGRRPDDIVMARFPGSKEVIMKTVDDPSDEAEEAAVYGRVLVRRVAAAISGADAASVAAEERNILDSLTAFLWNPNRPPKGCVLRSFGFWLGRPLGYTALVKLQDDSEVSHEVSPVIAFGIGYSPHAYLSFLVGTTLSYAGTEQVWSSTFAAGGNIDLVTSWLK
jgi:hypothetical protein